MIELVNERILEKAEIWHTPPICHSKLNHSKLNREGVIRWNEPEDLPYNIIFGMLSGKEAGSY